MHPTYAYKIAYSDTGEQTFINRDWRVDNFYQDKSGRRITWKMKDTPEFTYNVSFDLDGDGKMNTTKSLPLYDLWLEHLQTDQAIWVRSIILSQTDAKKNLDVVSRRYLEAIAGTGYAVVSLHDNHVVAAAKKFAAEKLGERALTIGKYPAYMVAVNVANVDQLEVDRNARQRRVLLVFVRTGYTHPVHGSSTRPPREFPTVLVAGYAAYPEEFDAGLPAFRHLLSKVHLYAGRADKAKNRDAGGDLIGPATPLVVPEHAFDVARPPAAPESKAEKATPTPPAQTPETRQVRSL